MAAIADPSKRIRRRRCLLEAPEKATAVLRRPFDDKGCRAAPFAAGGKALHQPADDSPAAAAQSRPIEL